MEKGKNKIIQKTAEFVKITLDKAEGGHDWWHAYRVWKLACHINKTEKADPFIVELGALLHDIADSKFHNGDEKVGPSMADSFLANIGVNSLSREHIQLIIKNISFSSGTNQKSQSPELNVIQDADRLDAIGAIGIARTFNYGGHKGVELYNPDIPPKLNMSKDEYKKNSGPTINHFYEKLLSLKDLMNTESGKKIARQRHEFMEDFLSMFYEEWGGKS